MVATIVEVQHLSRQFGDKLALDDVNFGAQEGLVYGLVGVNGAGKTTFIKHLMGLLRAQTGSVRIFGHDPAVDSIEVLSNVGYLSEKRELPEWMTVRQLMRYTRAYFPAWDNDYAQKLLDTFQLDDRRKVADLSSGMRAQAGLIVAVAYRPRLLILDEPSSGLDVVVREDILDAIVRTVRQEGRTVIFSSHLLDEVERMSDHITMIDSGRIALDDSLQNIQDHHFKSTIQFRTPIISGHPSDKSGTPIISGHPSSSESNSGHPLIQDTHPNSGHPSNKSRTSIDSGHPLTESRTPMIQKTLMNTVLSIDERADHLEVVHAVTPDQLADSVATLGGTVTHTRRANLMEVFIARVGRHSSGDVNQQ